MHKFKVKIAKIKSSRTECFNEFEEQKRSSPYILLILFPSYTVFSNHPHKGHLTQIYLWNSGIFLIFEWDCDLLVSSKLTYIINSIM